ncbi:GIY-YIG nuclease family protein [Mycolicibacterium sp. HK-90]|uniref:GIY-YIG nuclease family protein n=1 Tax=Mycolicibacterium sp. HK-90 TaxID=3056937 RepID=UPI002659B424|nr:GIY-YIG nuclease family protein [Mycolicibacterium sp. HK-90]WKG02618.1 GIY-YIG nuclease family protein [Mycolicibacterium sp. HK-90]
MGWPVRWLAVLCAVAVTVGGLHLVAPTPSSGIGQAARTVSAAEGFADAAVAAFTDSAVGSDPTLTVEQRSAGLPDEPVDGLTSHTAAGPVQVVLPGGLGAAQPTAGGQVVYPNGGAGFDFLAENTSTGTRTVARISDPGGPRMVTTFVRTPADTVILAHTNGYLTINRATPAAETIGMFSPAETRDATGRLVPSSYVVKQLAPQLYVLAEVIDPGPDTTWPVYVDPPLHLTGVGGAPLGLFDAVTSAVSSVADTVTSAASTAVSATVSGAKSVGSFVKENPLESALLVGGVALALTGVGGPASAAMIASATVNLASATVDIAAAAMPDNQALGIASTVLGAASMVTPQGAAKKVVTEGAELTAEQLAKHADDVVDVAKAAPTPPAQLADEVASAGAAKPTVTPGVSPKAPNAPPAGTKSALDMPVGTSQNATAPCGCHAVTPEPKGGVYVVYNGAGDPKYVGQTTDLQRRLNDHIREAPKLAAKGKAPRYDPAAGDTHKVLHRTDDPDTLNGLEQHEMNEHGTYTGTQRKPNNNHNGAGVNRRLVYRPTNKNATRYDAAAQAHLNQHRPSAAQPVARPSSPADNRLNQQTQGQAVTNGQRAGARSSAQQANESGSHGGSKNSGSSGKDTGDKSKKKDKKKKQSSRHKKSKRKSGKN